MKTDQHIQLLLVVPLLSLFPGRLAAADATVPPGGDAAERLTVPCCQPHDFSFKADANVANPFMVAFVAEAKGPDGKTMTLPGFFDGNGAWKVRVSPTVEGAWSLLTKSDLKELDGQTAAFACARNESLNAHGVLRVDKEQPHHFIFEDGTRFFMQGYEYDWLWALDMDKPGVPTVEQSLDLLARHGFNCVIPNSYAYFKHFGNFCRAAECWKLEPSDKLVNSGWCLAQPGREYVVFQNQQQPFTLNIADAKSPLQAEWFNPRTGKRSDAGSFSNGTASLSPPTDWGNVPLVLHLKAH